MHMQIHYGYEDLKFVRPVVTLGIFDGVHRGHRFLLDRVIKKACDTGGESVVITFYPHPRMVLDRNSKALTFLTTLGEKTALLEKSGIDHLIMIEFTREFSRISACDFVKDILVGKIGAKHLIVGYDHHFGRKGEGDFSTVLKCSESLDLSVERVEGLNSGDDIVSSSLVREALLSGRVEEAARLLGYHYELTGSVIEGRRLGRTIGFPTANILPNDSHKLIPMKGVYAVEVFTAGTMYPGMLSIGSNPTVNRDESFRSIEVHMIGFHGDVYNSIISVVFRKRLRDEIRFESIEALARQMESDLQATRKIFSEK